MVFNLFVLKVNLIIFFFLNTNNNINIMFFLIYSPYQKKNKKKIQITLNLVNIGKKKIPM